MFLFTAKVNLKPALTHDFWVKAWRVAREAKDNPKVLTAGKKEIYLSGLDEVLKARVQTGPKEQCFIKLFTWDKSGQIAWADADRKVYFGDIQDTGDIFPIRLADGSTKTFPPVLPYGSPAYDMANTLFDDFHKTIVDLK